METKIKVGIFAHDAQWVYLNHYLYLLGGNEEISYSKYAPNENYDIVIDWTDGRLVFSSLKLSSALKRKKAIFAYMMHESPVNMMFNGNNGSIKIKNIFDYIITWDDELADNERYYKFYYAYLGETKYYEKITLDTSEYDSKTLSVMVNGYIINDAEANLYRERIKIADYFEAYDDIFHVYGAGWDKYKNHKGTPPDKGEVYKKYRFAFALENHHGRAGYITEKILDAFKFGLVPVYKGASNILDYIPQNAFINYDDFISLEDLKNYLSSMTVETYNEYLANANDYLNSDKAKRFSPDNYVKTIHGIVLKIYNKGRVKTNIFKRCSGFIYFACQRLAVFLRRFFMFRIFSSVIRVFKKSGFRGVWSRIKEKLKRNRQ